MIYEENKVEKMMRKDAKPEIKSKMRCKLQFRAIKSLNNFQDRRYTTL